jgi:hypothetical protein
MLLAGDRKEWAGVLKARKSHPLRRQPEDHNFGSLVILAVTGRALLFEARRVAVICPVTVRCNLLVRPYDRLCVRSHSTVIRRTRDLGPYREQCRETEQE